MQLNVTGEAVLRSSYLRGKFNLDPNRMLQLMFSIDKGLNRFIDSWNENIFSLFQTLMQDSNDIDAWKSGLDSSSIFLDYNATKFDTWWNRKASRPYSILEGLELTSSRLEDLKALLTKSSADIKPVINKYLIDKFISLLDTPSSYTTETILKYSETNNELIYAPFTSLSLTGLPTTFLGLTDTPGSFLQNYLLTVNNSIDGVEFKSPGFVSRRKNTFVTNTSIAISSLSDFGNVLICDSGSSVVNITLDEPVEATETWIIVITDFNNGVNLVPSTPYTFEGSGSTEALITSPIKLTYVADQQDYKQIGGVTI